MKNLFIACALLAFGFLSAMNLLWLREPLWIESHNGQIAVVARGPDGRQFEVVQFDERLFDDARDRRGHFITVTRLRTAEYIWCILLRRWFC